jgi:hypothetical protein
MKTTTLTCVILGLLIAAYFSAQDKLQSKFDNASLRLGMGLHELEAKYGLPFAQDRNRLTYIFEDDSVLIVTLRDKIVTSAQLKYRHPLKIEDPVMQELTLVQMHSEENFLQKSTWFFAGRPEDGLIYKITSEGTVESLTWVPPFTFEDRRPKQLQALLMDFKSQQNL